MLCRQAVAVLAAFLLLNPGLSAAEPKVLSLRWSELESAVGGGKVKIVLPDGLRIEGRVMAVEPEVLRIRITRSSDRHAQPKGEASIPRHAVSVVEVVKYGKLWRLLGALAIPAGAASAAAITFPRDVSEGPVPGIVLGVSLAGVAGTALAGYYLGKRADRHRTTIRIIP